jgi:hypothetical protein
MRSRISEEDVPSGGIDGEEEADQTFTFRKNAEVRIRGEEPTSLRFNRRVVQSFGVAIPQGNRIRTPGGSRSQK